MEKSVQKIMIICYTVLEIWHATDGNCNFSFWASFCHFTPLRAPKLKIKKMKKNAWRYSFTQVYQKLWYALLLWDMAHDRCNCCFSFWAIFCPFTPNCPKHQFSKTMKKKSLEISSLYKCVPKIIIRWCTVPEIWCATGRWMDR